MGPVFSAAAPAASGGVASVPQQCGLVFSAAAPAASGGIVPGPWHGGPDYTAQLLSIYEQVVVTGASKFRVAHTPLPTNLNINAWWQLTPTHEDARVMEFLEFGFPVGYDGLVPTPGTLKIMYQMSVISKISQPIQTRSCREGTMLGPFASCLPPGVR